MSDGARPVTTARRRSLKAVRSRLGDRSTPERAARSLWNFAKLTVGSPIERFDMFAQRRGKGSQLGVYAFGGCDVRSVVGAGALLAARHRGTVCVASSVNAASTSSAIVVQTLNPPPPRLTAETRARLQLPGGYFEPELFSPEFSVRHQLGLGAFPKSVVVLSISADVARVLYQHRKHGFVVDPGGWWLNADLGSVLGDLRTARWFADSFRKLGRSSPETAMANFARIITEIRDRTGAFIAVLNVLTVDPGASALQYRRASSPHRSVRRQFNIALTELARELEFPVIDVDRIAKEHGIAAQADFVHYTAQQKRAISQQLVDVLAGAGILQP